MTKKKESIAPLIVRFLQHMGAGSTTAAEIARHLPEGTTARGVATACRRLEAHGQIKVRYLKGSDVAWYRFLRVNPTHVSDEVK